jgi:mitochondrial fission protein ELM1
MKEIERHGRLIPERLIWTMTTGEVGMRNQALGLARAVGGRVVEKTIRLRPFWRLFPGDLCPLPFRGLDPRFDVPKPPWPDLLITCGRRSTAMSIAVRRAAQHKTTTIHIQNPQCRLDAFDLVIALAHDEISGDNVLVVETALHAITPERLAKAAIEWNPKFAALPRPRLGVLVGGPTGGHPDVDSAESLISALERLHSATGAGIVLTASRRTPARVKALISERLATNDWAHVWDGSGANPYVGILAIADAFLVTSDSVSMISEALSTAKPVAVFPLAPLNRRHGQFIARLRSRGMLTDFIGDFPTESPVVPADAIQTAADRVKALLDAKARLKNVYDGRTTG